MDTRTQQSPFLLVIALAIICVVANISTLSATPAAAQSATETGGVLLTSPTLNVQIPGLRFASGLIAKPGEKTEIPYLAQYVAAAYTYLLGISVIAASVMIVYGGFKYIVSSSLTAVQSGKEIIKDAILGLLLVFGTYTLLQTLNPQLTSLKSVRILQVSKEEFKAGTSKLFASAQEKFCDTISSETPRTFTPASKAASVSVGTLTVSGPALKEYTLCGTSYTSDQTGEACAGRRCLNPTERCVSCSDATKAFPECAGKSSACIAGSIFGNIKWQDGSLPFGSLSLITVCSGAIKDKFTTWTAMSKPESIIKVGSVPLLGAVDKSKDKGSVAWKFAFPSSFDETVKKKCADNGQTFVGLYLEIEYAAGRGTPKEAGDIVFNGGANALVLKKNCGSGQVFSGYGDRSGLGPFICGEYFTRNLKPDAPLRKQISEEKIKQLQQVSDLLRDPKSYWSLDEIKAAQENLTPLACDIELNKLNAPAQADAAFYGKSCGGDDFAGPLKVLNFY